MRSTSNKIKYAVLGALIVPVFGRFALHGTGYENDFFSRFRATQSRSIKSCYDFIRHSILQIRRIYR